MKLCKQYSFSLNRAEILEATTKEIAFVELPEKAKQAFSKNLDLFFEMQSMIARGFSLSFCARNIAPRYNMTHRNAERLFKRVSESNYHWTSFLDKRYASKFWNAEEKEATLPKVFVDYWIALCLENQRCNRQAWFQLLRNLEAWRAGRGSAIPGYDVPPVNTKNNNYPQGWSYQNLLRFAPEKFELAAARLGRTAAMQTLPSVRTTRVGSEFFCELAFDDMWHDFMVSGFGNSPQAVRLLEFGAIDFHSGYYIPPLVKARIVSNSDGKMKNLNTRDFRFYLAIVLTQYGYNPNGTILTVEHGTAAISSELEKFLNDVSGGAIVVNRGGISGRGAYIGAYSERGKGNPRAKAIKEGRGKLIHNFFASLPGQVGTGVDARPAELWGRLKEYGKIKKLIADLPENKREGIKLGILPFDVASTIILEGYSIINANTEHNFEGWDELGYMLTEVRFSPSDDWQSFESATAGMSDKQKELVTKLIQTDSRFIRQRKLSPAEVFEMHKSKLVKLPEYLTPQIVGLDYATKRKPHRMVFEFKDAEIRPGLLRYHATAETLSGDTVQLRDNEEYLTFINPFNPSVMFVLGLNGSYIGVCREWVIPSRTDKDAVMRDYGKIQGMYTKEIQRVNRLKGAKQQQERNSRMLENTEILKGITQEDLLPETTSEEGDSTDALFATNGYSIDDLMGD